MPIYEYHCQGCGEDFDKLQSYKGRDLVSCPDCGARVTRKMSTFSFSFGNPFPKRGNIAGDGEGFTSKVVSKQEANERARANAGKYD